MFNFRTKTKDDWNEERYKKAKEESYFGESCGWHMWDWVTNTGDGLMGFRYGDAPKECLDFILTQFQRFNIPWHDNLIEIVQSGASATIYFFDVVDPYALFHDVSDVVVTDDWANYAYKLWDYDGKFSRDSHPYELETFAYAHGNSEAVFANLLAKPGLDALPHGHGMGIRALLTGDYNGEECWDSITDAADAALRDLCRLPDGEVDKKRMLAYFELSAWAAYLWMIGPESRDWKSQNHELIHECYVHGEVLLMDGTIISPDYFRKYDRPPMSCYRCGVQTWCVETSLVGNDTTLICEACLNFDIPKFGNANCGSKLCTFTACPNNPYHGYGREGSFQARREGGGQLTGMARGQSLVKSFASTRLPKQLGF